MVLSDVRVDALAFGKPPSGHDYPALFALGERDVLRAIWRSNDVGVTWVRVNDPHYEYGRRFRCIAGDPRVFKNVSTWVRMAVESSTTSLPLQISP